MYKPIAKIEVHNEDIAKYYWLDVTCTNCRLTSSLAFKKGDLTQDTACPTCENMTLIRVEH